MKDGREIVKKCGCMHIKNVLKNKINQNIYVQNISKKRKRNY